MSERTNFNLFENITRGMMGTAVPMLSGLIKSVVEMVPDLLKNILDTLSSIDLGEMILSIVDEVIPMLLDFLDPLLNLLGPAKETDATKLILTRKMKLKGKMSTIMRYIKATVMMGKIASEVPTEFPDEMALEFLGQK